jgi:hypothetical protein
MTVLGYYRYVSHEQLQLYLDLGWRLLPQRIDHHHEYGISLFWAGIDKPPEPSSSKQTEKQNLR